VVGLILRNPPPLQALLVGRHGWWSRWLPARALARLLPPELDSLRNGPEATAPAIFVRSEQDGLVPVPYQEEVYRAYGGPKRLVVVPGARHHDPLPEPQAREVAGHLDQVLREGRLRG
jgi:pimeloyl-ACP methyl ester carboxylesterase